MVIAFLACQLYVVLFIALHDWIPLGNLNNLAGIRTTDTTIKLVITTFLSTSPLQSALRRAPIIRPSAFRTGFFSGFGSAMWLACMACSELGGCHTC
jgi:hypothetical protein